MKQMLKFLFMKPPSPEPETTDIKDDLYLRLLKARHVKNGSSSVNHIFGDLALILYRKDGDEEETGEDSYSWVKPGDLSGWHMTAEDAFDAVLQRLSCSDEDEAVVLNACDMYGINSMQTADEYSFSDVPEGIILSTRSIVNGAVAVFYPGLLEKIADQLDSDLLIMFPSHFVAIIYPEKTHSAEDIQASLTMAVRSDSYKKSHHLSKRIFHYDKKEKTLSTVEQQEVKQNHAK